MTNINIESTFNNWLIANQNFSDARRYQGGRLAHQPNSLDDLDDDGDAIPFDNIPVRYDTTGMFSIY